MQVTEYRNLPIEQKNCIVNDYISVEANDIVKEFISQIKNDILTARKLVQGKECESLKDFGSEIIKRDGKEIGTVCFYAGFEKPYYSQLMTMAQILKGIEEGKTLQFFQVKYTGSGCWG